MSLISVDTEALKDIEKKFGTLSQKIGQTESNLKSIRSNLDSDIKNRNGIDSKLQNLIKELDEEERVLNQAKQFLSKTIKQYQDLEKSMQNKVNEINGDTKPKKNIFSKIFDAVTSPIKKNIEIIQKIISLPVIIGSTIIGNTVIKGVGELSEEGNTVTNEPIEEKKEKSENSSIPPLSGVLSYNPNVYSEEVLMMQKRLNEIYAGVSGYKKIKEDGYFGPETLAAVNRYKEEHGLWNFGEYEGKVGETTWNHMFTSEPKVNSTGGQGNDKPVIANSQGSGNGLTDAPIELLGQAQVYAEFGGARRIVSLTDLQSGKTFNISWASSPGYHTDWSPATAEDVEIIKSILPNGEWSWDPRPAVVTIDGRQIAVGIHLRPHAQNFAPGNGLPSASNERPKDGWGPGGHMCMYYGDSPPNNSDWDKRMNEAARIAFNWGKGE
jgi:uncharacterized membrane-anchored protein YhcB (DUF1043 family)